MNASLKAEEEAKLEMEARAAGDAAAGGTGCNCQSIEATGGDNRSRRLKPWVGGAWPSGLAASLAIFPE